MKPLATTFHVLMIVSLLCVAMLTGCNTLRGVGRDVEATGDRIGDATR